MGKTNENRNVIAKSRMIDVEKVSYIFLQQNLHVFEDLVSRASYMHEALWSG